MNIAEIVKRELSKPNPLDHLPPEHRAAVMKRMAWLAVAGNHQIEPTGDWWSIWLLLAGRGAGKTRTAAEECWWTAWDQPNIRYLVSAPTSADVRDTCFEGESGILNVIPHEIIMPNGYKSSLNELTLINGSLIKGIPASEPGRFRGPQFHHGWLDELAAWDYLDESWDMIQFGMRLGQRPKLICTTTPKPKPLIVDLVARDGDDVAYVSASTYDNIDNLAPTFKKQILQYEGTTLGRQELYAELIDPEESGIIKRPWFKLWPANRALPQFTYVVQSYDCATSDKTANDPTACVVLGIFKPSPDKPMSAMVIDCWTEHMQYPDLRPRVVEEYGSIYGDDDEWGNGKKVDLVLIEDKSAGISLIQDLQRAGLPVRAYNPGQADKTTRLNIVSPIIARGLVYLPESETKPKVHRTWCDPLVNQLCAFPEVRHDDLVDATSQALRYLRDAGFLTTDYVADDSDMYVDETQPRRINPYAA